MKQANYEFCSLFGYHSKHRAAYPTTTHEYPSFLLFYTASGIQQSNPYNTCRQIPFDIVNIS